MSSDSVSTYYSLKKNLNKSRNWPNKIKTFSKGCKLINKIKQSIKQTQSNKKKIWIVPKYANSLVNPKLFIKWIYLKEIMGIMFESHICFQKKIWTKFVTVINVKWLNLSDCLS